MCPLISLVPQERHDTQVNLDKSIQTTYKYITSTTQ